MLPTVSHSQPLCRQGEKPIIIWNRSLFWFERELQSLQSGNLLQVRLEGRGITTLVWSAEYNKSASLKVYVSRLSITTGCSLVSMPTKLLCKLKNYWIQPSLTSSLSRSHTLSWALPSRDRLSSSCFQCEDMLGVPSPGLYSSCSSGTPPPRGWSALQRDGHTGRREGWGESVWGSNTLIHLTWSHHCSSMSTKNHDDEGFLQIIRGHLTKVHPVQASTTLRANRII